MSRGHRLLLLVLALFGVLDVLFATRIAGRDRDARLELGRHKLTQVSEATRARLAGLSDSVLLTLFVSPRDQMPSDLRRLEQDARDVLEALKAAGGGKVEYQIVDPTAEDALQRFASRRKVAPVRVRSVERDGWTEKTVWASLGITCGARPPVVLNGLRPEQLPLLQDLLVAQLDQLEHPRRPVIALAAPGQPHGESFADVAAELALRADLLRVDLDAGAPFPQQADVLVWLQPGPVEAARVHELDLFLQSGRSVIVAGSPRLGPFSAGVAAGAEAAAPRPVESGFATLLSGFGLSLREGLLGDTMTASLKSGETDVPAPWLLRCIAPQQDFHSFKGQPNGHLYFECAAPFALDGEKLRARALVADVLGTASDGAWLQPEAGVTDLTQLAATAGEPAPRVPLMVALRPADPWQGVLVAIASSTPFEDGWYHAEGNAHPRLVKVLLDNLTTDERLLSSRLLAQRAAPLPELPARDRVLWRALCIGLLPLLLLVVAFARGAFRAGDRPSRAARPAVRPFRAATALRLLAGVVVIGALVGVARGAGLRADLTQDGIHELHPRTAELAAAATGSHALRAELWFSPPDRLPPSLRPVPARLTDALADLARAGASVEVEVKHPEDLPQAEQDALAAQGLLPSEVATRDEEVTSVRKVWASLRLSSADGHSTVLPFGGASDLDALPFRLAFALWRLQTGREVTVGFAGDAPRLTAAEAFELYQQQGLFAPAGTDVYALAAAAIAAADFRVERVNPRSPTMPADLDALVWLQPRRSIDKMLEQTVMYLHGGGHVLLAAQPFVMQPRQFPGRDYLTVWWPAPQTPDVDKTYFPDLGVQLVREVLFDKLQTSAPLETLVYAGTRRDARRQESALPFLLRVSAANFADDPLVRGLSDQAFLCPTYFRLDQAALAAAGLTARPLFTCSERSWSYEWKAGFLDPQWLVGPLATDTAPASWLGKVPLGVDVTGVFPIPPQPIVAAPLVQGPDGQMVPGPPREWPPPDAPAPKPGRLVFLGETECFKN
ncbi:MAG TPA: Gldg family protein, partial [Planctomycetota bacterium]|nr:Gldg family protein [Planctomycetota bacterium]